MRLAPLFIENLNVAIKSIKTNRLRSALTILIIAIGITSLVGVLTATDALKSEVFSSYEKMGMTSFYIGQKRIAAQTSDHKRIRNNKEITYFQARSFKERFDEPCAVTIFTGVSATIKYGAQSSTPVMSVMAADENYLEYMNSSVAQGRGILESDVEMASYICIIGTSVAKSLFLNEPPLGKVLSIGGVRYEVVGIIKTMGAAFGNSLDNEVVIPVSNARSHFMGANTSFVVGAIPRLLSEDMTPLYDKAEQLFRSIRRLSPIDESDFDLVRSDAMLSDLTDVMGTITMAAAIIGLITLLGAAVGLMNIMLVSVKERTNEIGVRKAIGASASLIKQQFLLESIVISQIGCALGVLIGISIGNATALFMGVPFIIPWVWILFAVIVCLIVGILSGYIPAVRAANLDPIEALRYE
jgi:putative ABC transport system permease protein